MYIEQIYTDCLAEAKEEAAGTGQFNFYDIQKNK